jgi:hypothetical protein
VDATIYLGNRDTIELLTDDAGEQTRRPVEGKLCSTFTTPVEGIGAAELIQTIVAPGRGMWAQMSDGDPAWVAVDVPGDPGMGTALAQILSQHWGGIEIRDPDPDHQPATNDDDAVEG